MNRLRSSLHLKRKPLEPCDGSVPRNLTLAVCARWFALTFTRVILGFVLSRLKTAVTDTSVLSVTWHARAFEQPPPDQWANVETGDALAVSFTGVPVAKEPTQVEPHLTPAGELVTEPPPKPPRVTVSVCPMSTTCALLPTAFWKWTMSAPWPWSAA